MFAFSLVETFVNAPLNMVSWITDMVLREVDGKRMLYAATRSGGGVLALDATAALQVQDSVTFSVTSQLPVEATLDILMISGKPHLVVSGSNQSATLTYRLDGAGDIEAAVKPVGSLSGVISAQQVVQTGGQTYFYAARANEGVVHAYSVANSGTMTALGQISIGTGVQGVNIGDLQQFQAHGQSYLAALSLSGDSIHVLRVGAGGALTETGWTGAALGLGLADPSAVRTVTLGTQVFLVVASASSSSLTVLLIDANGVPKLTDHVIDTLDTRLAGVQALSTVVVGDRAFVLAGGNDGGLHLLQLLPDGRLVPAGHILQVPGLALGSISAITTAVSGGVIEVFVASEGAGITRMTVDVGILPAAMTGGNGADTLTGGDGADLLIGGAGNDFLNGGQGSDVLMDGVGSDSLQGGAGADLFVMAADGATDRILDFQVGIDRLDLSAWGRIHSTSAVQLVATTSGLRISFGNEVLEIVSSNGLAIQPHLLRLADLVPLWRQLPTMADADGWFRGSSASEMLLGGSYSDSFFGSGGADTIDGGSGVDRVDYSGLDAGKQIILDLLAAAEVGWVTDRLTDIENVVASEFADRVIGNSALNSLFGRSGDDYLRGWAGNDRLFGEDGNDVLLGDEGSDSLAGGDGDDFLRGGQGTDTLDGGAGLDTASYATASLGVRVYLAPELAHANRGEAAGDTLTGIENVNGSAYNDILRGDDNANKLTGGNGDDSLIGDGEADRLEGQEGDDSLYGGSGDDLLLGGDGADYLDGGAGRDMVSYLGASQGALVDLSNAALNSGAAAGDVLHLVEIVLGSEHADTLRGASDRDLLWGEAGNDRIEGRDGFDTLYGQAGDDSLYGGSGNDLLRGGPGADFHDGGAGIDWVLYNDATEGVLADLGVPANGQGEAAGDTYQNVENMLGSFLNDTLRGDDAKNFLYGLLGDDLLEGRGGDDRLHGLDGNDTMLGGAGDDSLRGGTGADALFGADGIDWADYIDATSGIVADLLTPGGNTGIAAGDTYDGIEGIIGSHHSDTLRATNGDDFLYGYFGNDVLHGRDGDDYLLGHQGADSLFGGGGDDTLRGGTGADLLDGGDGDDLVSYASASNSIRVDLANASANSGEGAGDVFVSIENLQGSAFNDTLSGDAQNNRLEGLAGNDRLDGRAGNDWLTGMEGNDTLIGGDGNDTLSGGTGADVFVFADGRDIILDYNDAVDMLHIDNALWGNTARSIADILHPDNVLVTASSVFLVFSPTDRLEIRGLSDAGLLADNILIV